MSSSIKLPESPGDKFAKSWKGAVFFVCFVLFMILYLGRNYFIANFNSEFRELEPLVKTRPEVLADLPFVFSVSADENSKFRQRWASTEAGGFYHVIVYGYASARAETQTRYTYCVHFLRSSTGVISIQSVSPYCKEHD